jgi:hypothetical protein
MAQSGGIGTQAIQIDGNANSVPGADHFANLGTPLNAGATLDWVAGLTGNTGTNCLVDSVAECNEANVTAAAGGAGTWNGVRIVDGIAGNDQDIFLTGGKEDDVTTWNVGPGTVGSSKYDSTQSYLANSQTNLYFGMERRGNNGTTAFDFEFNQVGSAGGYIPTRTIGDILFTWEMQGSGGSGSAVGYVFQWDGDSYNSISASGLLATINNSTTTPAPPWGHVNSHGNWVLGNLERFEFAEATAPLSLLPGVNACGGVAYVQIRTRSSSAPNSDLKDTTKIFEFLFGGPSAAAALNTGCPASGDTQPHFDFSAVGSTNAAGGTTGLTYSWVFTPTNGATIVGGNAASVISGTRFINMNGAASTTISAEVVVTENATCTASRVATPIIVYPVLTGSPTLSAGCDLVIAYNASNVTGGKAPLSYSWQFQRLVSGNWVNAGTASGVSGNFTAPEAGTYRAVLTVTDDAGCSYVVNTGQVTAAPALTASAAKTSEDGTNMTVTLTGTTNDAGASLQWQRLSGANWVNIAGETASTLVYSSFEADGVASNASFSIGSDSYVGKIYTVQLRVNATSVRNGQNCVVSSNAVTVKKVIAVDP